CNGSLEISSSDTGAEREARSVAASVTSGNATASPKISAPASVQRDGAVLAWEADLRARASRVKSIGRSGNATASLYPSGQSGKLGGYQITQNFELELASGAPASDYAIVQWVKGDLYEQRGNQKVYWPANYGLFGRSATDPWHFTEWIIDTPDAD